MADSAREGLNHRGEDWRLLDACYIEDLGDNRWKARGYRVEAASLEEARSQLQLNIYEEAVAMQDVVSLRQQLKTKRARLGELDRTQAGGKNLEVNTVEESTPLVV